MTEPSCAHLLISLAEAGDLAAIGEIADRLEGRPWQSMEHLEPLTREELVAAIRFVSGNGWLGNRSSEPGSRLAIGVPRNRSTLGVCPAYSGR